MSRESNVHTLDSRAPNENDMNPEQIKQYTDRFATAYLESIARNAPGIVVTPEQSPYSNMDQEIVPEKQDLSLYGDSRRERLDMEPHLRNGNRWEHGARIWDAAAKHDYFELRFVEQPDGPPQPVLDIYLFHNHAHEMMGSKSSWLPADVRDKLDHVMYMLEHGTPEKPGTAIARHAKRFGKGVVGIARRLRNQDS